MTHRRTLLALPVLAMIAAAALAADANAPINLADYKPPICVACIGDSITEGVGAPGGWAWADQLDRMLDDKWDARNFGKSYAQALKSARRPYWGFPEFKTSRAFCPDVVVIVLGTNDAAAVAKESQGKEFARDYRDLVSEYQKLPSKPRIFLCTPPWAAGAEREANYKPVIETIGEIAKDMGCGMLDLYAPLAGKKPLFPDGLHPNTEGATVIAATVYKALTGKAWEGEVPGPLAAKKPKPVVVTVENPGDLTYAEAFALVASGARMTAEQLAPIGRKYAEEAPAVEVKVLQMAAEFQQYDSLRMKFKHTTIEAEKPLYGEYKGKAAEKKKELEKYKREKIDELISMIPTEAKAGFGAARLGKYIFDRLAPIASTLTAEQRQKIRDLCASRGEAYARINNTPERSVEDVEAYKVVYQQILDPDQKRRVEPR